MTLNEILIQLSGLIGWGAFVAFAINALKRFGVVKDGQAATYSLGLNLVGLIGLVALRLFSPGFDVAAGDAQLATLVQALGLLFGLFTEMGSSILMHKSVASVPVVGKSFSLEKTGKA